MEIIIGIIITIIVIASLGSITWQSSEDKFNQKQKEYYMDALDPDQHDSGGSEISQPG